MRNRIDTIRYENSFGQTGPLAGQRGETVVNQEPIGSVISVNIQTLLTGRSFVERKRRRKKKKKARKVDVEG